MHGFVKFILWFFLVVLLLGFGLFFFRAQVASLILSQMLHNRISIHKILFQEKRIEFQNVVLSNPKGFSSEPAMQISSISLTMPYKDPQRQIFCIDSLIVSQSHVLLEFQGVDNNFSTIASKMKGSEDSGRRRGNRGKRDSYVLIKELTLNEMNVKLLNNNGSMRMYAIPRTTFRDLKTTKKDIVRQISRLILHRVMNRVKDFLRVPFNFMEDPFIDDFEFFGPPWPFSMREKISMKEKE